MSRNQPLRLAEWMVIVRNCSSTPPSAGRGRPPPHSVSCRFAFLRRNKKSHLLYIFYIAVATAIHGTFNIHHNIRTPETHKKGWLAFLQMCSKVVKISGGCLEIGCLQFFCLWYFDAIYEFYFASCFYCRIVNNSLLVFHGIHIIYIFSIKFMNSIKHLNIVRKTYIIIYNNSIES